MKSIQDVRSDIISYAWNLPSQDAKRSPQFLKYLESTIRNDRQELLSEILAKVEEVDSYYDAVESIKQFKIK